MVANFCPKFRQILFIELGEKSVSVDKSDDRSPREFGDEGAACYNY
jgi:hypothetical protein